jgi:hypothetical protein
MRQGRAARGHWRRREGVIRLFTGWDAREALGWHAFTQKVIELEHRAPIDRSAFW